jgi:hypothetical protein
LIVDSVKPKFHSALSFWEVGVGTWQSCADTRNQRPSHR